MANNTEITLKQDVKTLLDSEALQRSLEKSFADEGKRKAFRTSVLSLVNGNVEIAKCEPLTVINAALQASTLDLPINQNLGFAWIIAYAGKAQFQIGYKGFVQLAQRSGQFHRISATPIYEGQIMSENPLTGYEFNFTVKGEKVIGYAAYFRLKNGFEATMYKTVEEVTVHAKRFSKSYNSGPWKTDFDAMARKTVLKLLLAQQAPLSIEMQDAMTYDQSVISNLDGKVEYLDNSPETNDWDHMEQLLNEKMTKLTKEELQNAERIIENKEVKSYNKLKVLLESK